MGSSPIFGSKVMQITSHRLRSEEKKLYRKLLFILAVIFSVVFLFIYAGLPLLAKIIVAVTSVNQNTVSQNQTGGSLYIFPPVLDPQPESTNSSELRISGYSEKETTIKIYLNGDEAAKILADLDGRFQTNKLSLKEGSNTIQAISVIKNQESSPSSAISILYKKSLPLLEIDNPENNEKFSSGSQEISIQGSTDPGNRVTINDRFVIVNQEGKFNYTVRLSDGENKYKITASDPAGNQISEERTVTFIP